MKVYLDCDCVKVNFSQAWVDWTNKVYAPPVPVKTSDILDWDWMERQFGPKVCDFFMTPGAYDSLIKPFPGAKEFVETLRSKGFDVWSLTSSSKVMEEEKTKYINRHFGIPEAQVIHAKHKYQFSKDGVLVDDYHVNIHHHVERTNMPGIAFNLNNLHPWAEESAFDLTCDLVHYATTYDRVVEILEEIREEIHRHTHSLAFPLLDGNGDNRVP